MKTHVIASSSVRLVESAVASAFADEFSRELVSYAVSPDLRSSFPAVVAPYGRELASPKRFPDDMHLSSAFAEREVRRLFKTHGPYRERECDTIYVGLNLLTRFRLEGEEQYPKTGAEMDGFLSGRIGDSCDYVFFVSVGNPFCSGTYPTSMYAFGKKIVIVAPSDGDAADGPIGEFFRYAEPEVGLEVGGYADKFFVRTRRRYYRPFGFN